MRLCRQGYESRTDSIRDLRCDSLPRAVLRQHGSAANEQRRSSWTMARHAPSQTSAARKQASIDQEQIQMIATAIGTPKPSAPKIAGTNSESRPTWCFTPGDDMTCSLEPREPLPAPKMNDQSRLRTKVRDDSLEGQCWGVMVNKWLTGIKRSLQTAPRRRRAAWS
jgi:hypothetical protein